MHCKNGEGVSSKALLDHSEKVWTASVYGRIFGVRVSFPKRTQLTDELFTSWLPFPKAAGGSELGHIGTAQKSSGKRRDRSYPAKTDRPADCLFKHHSDISQYIIDYRSTRNASISIKVSTPLPLRFDAVRQQAFPFSPRPPNSSVSPGGSSSLADRHPDVWDAVAAVAAAHALRTVTANDDRMPKNGLVVARRNEVLIKYNQILKDGKQYTAAAGCGDMHDKEDKSENDAHGVKFPMPTAPAVGCGGPAGGQPPPVFVGGVFCKITEQQRCNSAVTRRLRLQQAQISSPSRTEALTIYRQQTRGTGLTTMKETHD